MIRGVDRDVRKAAKDAAKAEGLSVGAWVRRSILRALDAAADGHTTATDLGQRMHLFEARLSVLEKSHRGLYDKVRSADIPASEKQTSWKRPRKSK